MKHYLSFGGGVNSTALMLLLLDRGVEFEAVYADHGADWPETREYVKMLDRLGYPITWLETTRGDLSLYGYYWQYRMIPQRTVRACTRLYKLVPLSAYMTVPCVVYVGIASDEAHRIPRLIAGQRKGEEKLFPLADEGIDRKGCIEIIGAHGLRVPMRSGCFICPNQRRSQWIYLRTVHPELYCRAKALEDRCNERMRELEREPFYLADRPLDQVAMDEQSDLFGERDMRPCLCELR